MAMIGTQQDDDELPTSSSSKNAQATLGGVPAAGSGGGFAGGTGTGSGQGATTGVAAGNATPGGGNYTNLLQYLNANQGTGGTTGQAAENVVQQSADKATQAQNTYNTNASNEIAGAAAGLGVNQGVLGQIKSGAAGVDNSMLGKISSGGYSYTPDTATLNNLGTASKDSLDKIIAGGKAATGAYTGPSDFSKVAYGGPTASSVNVSYGGPTATSNFNANTLAAQGAAQGAGDVVSGNVANATGGNAGVSSLLKNAYQAPNYTQGENNLDTFLAGGTAGGKAALGQASGVGQGVSNNYDSINNALMGKIGDANKLAGATNATYQNAINDATNASKGTQNQYNLAMSDEKSKALTNQKSAQADAKRAQDEEDRRAAEEKKKALVKPITGKAGPQEVNIDQSGTTPGSSPGGDDGSYQRDPLDQYLKVRTDAVTKPLMTKVVNPVVNTVKNTVKAIPPPVMQVLAPTVPIVQKIPSVISNISKKLHFAEGGEVPSYEKLCKMLRGK